MIRPALALDCLSIGLLLPDTVLDDSDVVAGRCVGRVLFIVLVDIDRRSCRCYWIWPALALGCIVLIDGVASQYILYRLTEYYRTWSLDCTVSSTGLSVKIYCIICRSCRAIYTVSYNGVDGRVMLSAGFGARLLEYRSIELSDVYYCGCA